MAGARPIEAINALSSECEISRTCAKQELHQSHAWAKEAKATEALHESLYNALQDELEG